MFEKYFNGVIEQVFHKVSKEEKNIVMVCYNNVFYLERLESIKRYSENGDNVFFAWKEYDAEQIVGAYDPFLDIICQMYRTYIHGDFDAFLTECGVYELHRDILRCYFETGVCKRSEEVLLDEVEYEQHRMVKTICLMLKRAAEYKPIVLVINRFQMAARSTMNLVQYLVEEPSANIGMVLAVNDTRIRKESPWTVWEKITEILGDRGLVYHIGNSGQHAGSYQENTGQPLDYEKVFTQLNNVIELLDYEQADEYLQNMERQVKQEELSMPDEWKLSMYFMHTKVAVLMGDMPRALALIEDTSRLHVAEHEDWINYRCSMDIAACYMYQGRMEAAYQYAESAKESAEKMGKEELVFPAEVLMLRTRMSGWHNIPFCVTDVDVDASLIEKLVHYNYRNHLAHVYIYAYDNEPEMVRQAYHSESALVHFTKGVRLAKEIGNEKLVCSAYQKNAMIASANGMNEVALLYAIRTYQFIQNHASLEAGRMLSAMGYHLSALGHMDKSGEFYQRSVSLLYGLQLPEDIAEVCYNAALTCFLQEKYKQGETALKLAVKTVDKLNLNGLRVCNLAKLHALQSLFSTMQGNRFDAERYLFSCEQFMNYIIIKQDEEVVHDFARSDDDICLYYFAKAMQEMAAGDDGAALDSFDRTEKYFERAEGNLFYIHCVYRKARMDLYRRLGKAELVEEERARLMQHQRAVAQTAAGLSEKLLIEVHQGFASFEPVSISRLEDLIRQESMVKENKQIKRELEFISIWQDMRGKSNVRVYELVKDSVRLFLNQFNNDCALYVRYNNGTAQVLYNDTGVFLTEDIQKKLEKYFTQYSDGIAVSKISHTFFEHRDIIEMFDVDEVCSFVAVPFFKKGNLESFFITYIKMKDNWHDSVNRYLLDEDDLRVYKLLFRELGHTIHRLESYEKIYQMNKRLQESATTDVLTGITNRMGMYERVHMLLEERKKDQVKQGLGVMFLDLDNFKPYNDTYGHEAGDTVLRGMAGIFRAAVGEKGFVSRYGGDEFIIITYVCTREELETIAEEIYHGIQQADGFIEEIQRLSGEKVEMDSKDKISCSIGIMLLEEFTDENLLDEMIKKADDSLYSVKVSGKGKYVFA